MAVQQGVSRANGGRLDHGVYLDQLLTDLGRTPLRLLLLQPDYQSLHLKCSTVRVRMWGSAAVLHSVSSALLVAAPYLMPGNS